MRKRKTFVKVGGSRIKVVMKKSMPGKAKCGSCRKELHGMPRISASRFRKIGLSEKRPNRPYGGNLCSKCMRMEISRKARA
ncbi:50S ribosomal protein L34e [Candidatus Woesearchaeota archaeon]|nr:50S ribosomal protein L34e [Candidatus Woesearchaeota archaeon]